MTKDSKKRLKNAGIATVAATMLISGSLAWRDVSQHKTNKFKTRTVTQSMVLVENFNEVSNWSNGQTVRKEVRVRNGQNTDNTDVNIYEDGFVRLQLREFLGKGTPKENVTKERYLIDLSGNYVKGERKDEAFAAAQVIWEEVPKSNIVQVKTHTDAENNAPANGFWYVKTDENAPNGVYGKFIQQSIEEVDKFTSIVDGKVVSENDVDASLKIHNENPNKEANSSIEDNQFFSTRTAQSKSKFDEYVKLDLNDDKVIKKDDWKADGKKPGAYWILDEDNGWAYWGQSLFHGKNGSVLNHTMTENFLNSVKLEYSGGEKILYRLHVNMDAVSKEDIKLWADADEDIKTMLGGFTPGDDHQADNENLFNQHRAQRDANIMFKSAYHKDVKNYVTSMDNAADALVKKDFKTFAKEMDDVESYKNAAKLAPQSNTKYDEIYFASNTNKASRYWYLGDADNKGTKILIMNFQEDEETSYLKNKFADKIASYSFNGNGYSWYSKDNSEGKQWNEVGYENSVIKKVAEARYEYNLKGTEYEKYVMPLNVVEENTTMSKPELYHRTDAVTTVDKNSTTKFAMPSASDVNHYKFNIREWRDYKVDVQNSTKEITSWTRGTGERESHNVLWGYRYIGGTDDNNQLFSTNAATTRFVLPMIMVNPNGN